MQTLLRIEPEKCVCCKTCELFNVIAGESKLLDRCLVISLADFHFSFLELMIS